ncbi:hypothetical protein NMY22_g8295 [Coprinellus aureogranulatus]|nr:hypothetical protein NMY22_g8295 [Coprinellus aureogranulatus]
MQPLDTAVVSAMQNLSLATNLNSVVNGGHSSELDSNTDNCGEPSLKRCSPPARVSLRKRRLPWRYRDGEGSDVRASTTAKNAVSASDFRSNSTQSTTRSTADQSCVPGSKHRGRATMLQRIHQLEESERRLRFRLELQEGILKEAQAALVRGSAIVDEDMEKLNVDTHVEQLERQVRDCSNWYCSEYRSICAILYQLPKYIQEGFRDYAAASLARCEAFLSSSHPQHHQDPQMLEASRFLATLSSPISKP